MLHRWPCSTHTPAAWAVALGIEHRANSTFPGSVGEGRMGRESFRRTLGNEYSRGKPRRREGRPLLLPLLNLSFLCCLSNPRVPHPIYGNLLSLD